MISFLKIVQIYKNINNKIYLFDLHFVSFFEVFYRNAAAYVMLNPA